MAGADSDLPPPYHSLSENSNTEKNDLQGTDVVITPSYDEPETFEALFDHKDNKIGFIQKVILIKLLQTLLAAIPLAVFASTAEFYKIYGMLEYDYHILTSLIVLSLVVLLAVLGLIHYCDEARFAMPFNHMFLLTYPLSIGFFVGAVSWPYGSKEVFISWMQFIVTLFFMMAYSILALQSKIEFKTSISFFLAAGSFILSYAVMIPFIYVDPFIVFYCSLALLGLAVYILYEIQIMTSRNYHLHLSPSDFVKAAVIMHVDYRFIITNMLKKYTDHDVDSALNDAEQN